MASASGGSGGGGVPMGISLSNTVHSEVAPSLPLPSLPVFCGAVEQELSLFNDGGDGSTRLSSSSGDVSGKIADLLRHTDVAYLNLKDEERAQQWGSGVSLNLFYDVLRHDPEAFECSVLDPDKQSSYRDNLTEPNPSAQGMPTISQVTSNTSLANNYHLDDTRISNIVKSAGKPRLKKKRKDDSSVATPCLDAREQQEVAVLGFCQVLEDICSRAEVFSDEQEELELSPLAHADIKVLVNEVVSIRSKGILGMVPVDILLRTLKVLDHQIHRAEGLSIDDCENGGSDVSSAIYCSLEAIHAALAIMTHDGMPKQLYKEENIERILEFSIHQIMELLFASDPSYRSLHKPSCNGPIEEEDDDDDAGDSNLSNKRRRTTKTRVWKSTTKRVSSSVNVILQKLCTILGFVKHLLMIERLSDSCILQLVRTSLQTLFAANVHLLQLKAISLIGGIYYAYSQHRSYVMDETLQVLLKLPLSKRVPRTYHLPDEEQRQIQLVAALLIQMIHYSANLPEVLRQASRNPSPDASIDADYPFRCHEAITESCCLFWSQVLQRYASSKNQETSEVKAVMENLVVDLLSTLNLPEYPASATLLEVLCVLLLQNAGLKSKDIAARTMAIDLLGTIAARLKHDAVLARKEKFWIVQELMRKENVDGVCPKVVCSICFSVTTERPVLVCQGCDKQFHVDCIEGREKDDPFGNFDCLVCLFEKQLCILKANFESQNRDEKKQTRKNLRKSSRDAGTVTKEEVVQQMLLNYLQDVGMEDEHMFVRWFYLCLWYKDDPTAQEKIDYFVTRLRPRTILHDSISLSSLLSRDSVKKITLALVQNSSFARGFGNILKMLLTSLRENSPVIRSKAMRAVSIIVEADPEVLGDKLVQAAVEGRFCDSAISVREAALELVGRYISSHPDVGLKYFDKVVERIKDTGVSVRKRAIKIIREMCLSTPGFSQQTAAYVEIISRINDEEASIQELVCKTFYEFWFEESGGSENHLFKDGSCIPLEVSKKTDQMVGVLKRMPSHQPLSVLIRRILALDYFPQSSKAAGINPALLASVRRRCQLMCRCLLENILQVAEMNSEEAEGYMLPNVLLLHAFCLVDPTLCTPASDPSQFVTTLEPYLKFQSDNRLAARLLESILFIIDSVLPLLRKLSHNVVEDLEQDLKQMIVRHSFLTVVHACIKCLCSVGKASVKGGNVVEYLIQLFYKRLGVLGLDSMQVGRSLFCLGLLIRYGSSLLGLNTDSSRRNIDFDSSIGLFKKYLQADDFGIKARALQALGHAMIAQPESMLQKDVHEILEGTLSVNADTPLKLQSLQNIFEYLLDAESKMQPEKETDNEGTDPVKDARGVPVAAGAGDTNICGGIVQLYWNSILQRSLDVNEHVRNAALKIMDIVLRQGLVHPITCVPHLIALETDPDDDNSKTAHLLLISMNEKYPAFCESRLGDGLLLSFRFIHSIAGRQAARLNLKGQSRLIDNMKGKPELGSSIYARHGVARIYKLIRGSRASRNRFMSSVVLKFEMPDWSDSVAPFLLYCTEILALLPFTTPDEPLYLIYAINRAVQVRSGAIESTLKDILQSLQGTTHKADGNGLVHIDQNISVKDESPGANDGDYRASGDGAHMNSRATVMSNDVQCTSDSELHKFQADCLAAGALVLLLKLKRYLKVVYSLDDARCQAYSPNDPVKPGENLSRQNIPLNISDVNIDPPSTFEDLLRRYQDFKNALREDTVDYSTYTANIRRKKPTPRKGSKTSRGMDEDEYDDEDWNSGRANRSGGRRGGSGSRSRQRVQL